MRECNTTNNIVNRNQITTRFYAFASSHVCTKPLHKLVRLQRRKMSEKALMVAKIIIAIATMLSLACGILVLMSIESLFTNSSLAAFSLSGIAFVSGIASAFIVGLIKNTIPLKLNRILLVPVLISALLFLGFLGATAFIGYFYG